MPIAAHQKKIATSAIYRLLIISVISYGLCAVFFNIYPTTFLIDSIQPTVTCFVFIALLAYFHRRPFQREKQAITLYTAITILTFTPATFYFTIGAWLGKWSFIETYPPISSLVLLNSTIVMLMLPRKYTKLAALIWALNALPVLLYLFFHKGDLQTPRGHDLLFLFGPASLLILVIIPYQQNISTHMDKISFELIRSKLDADRDFLTDTFNRRGLQNWLDRTSPMSSIAVLLIDVDHFKRINDHYGHNVGDMVLVEIASRLRTVYHENYCLARWGGEEFILVIADPNQENLQQIANDAHSVFSRFPYKEVGTVTASIGVSRIGEIRHFAQFVEEADQALYFAKTHGRNQVAHFNSVQFMTTKSERAVALVD